MKKVLLGLLALSAVSFAAAGDSAINLRVGGDLGAKWSKGVDEDTDQTFLSDKTDGFGGEVAIEYLYSLNDNFSLGGGLAYQKHADRDEFTSYYSNYTETDSGLEYDSVPLYLTVEYKFITESGFNPYLKANLGYSFNVNSSAGKYKATGSNGHVESGKLKNDTDNGLYWALGGGVEYNNFTVDLMYAVTKAKSKLTYPDGSSDKYNNDYGRVVLSAGYRFNL